MASIARLLRFSVCKTPKRPFSSRIRTLSTIDDWNKRAEKELKGKPIDSLTWKTPEGIDVKPLYTAQDLEVGGCILFFFFLAFYILFKRTRHTI